MYNKKVQKLSPEIKASKSLFNRFRSELDQYMQQLTEQKKTTMLTVASLAESLFVNPNYLNSIIKNISGKTASAHLQEKMVLEAQAYLMHTDLQVTEIAYKLGFENSSYFTRFFKKHTSLSPLEYRNQFFKR